MDKVAQLQKIASLKEKGILSDEEFNLEKKKILDSDNDLYQIDENLIELPTENIKEPNAKFYKTELDDETALVAIFSIIGCIMLIHYATEFFRNSGS